MNRDGAPRKTLADIITEKINEKRTEKYERFPMAQNIQGLSALPKVTKSLPHIRF